MEEDNVAQLSPTRPGVTIDAFVAALTPVDAFAAFGGGSLQRDLEALRRPRDAPPPAAVGGRFFPQSHHEARVRSFAALQEEQRAAVAAGFEGASGGPLSDTNDANNGRLSLLSAPARGGGAGGGDRPFAGRAIEAMLMARLRGNNAGAGPGPIPTTMDDLSTLPLASPGSKGGKTGAGGKGSESAGTKTSSAAGGKAATPAGSKKKPKKLTAAEEERLRQAAAEEAARLEAEERRKEEQAAEERRRSRPVDMWAALAERMASEADADIADRRKHLTWAVSRGEYLRQKEPNQYWIEDVLGEFLEPDEAPTSEGAKGNGGASHGTLDAVAYARARVEMLQRTVGYVPPRGMYRMSGNSHALDARRATEAMTEEDKRAERDHLLSLMTEHAAGGSLASKTFACGATLASNIEQTVLAAQQRLDAEAEAQREAEHMEKITTKSSTAAAAASVLSPRPPPQGGAHITSPPSGSRGRASHHHKGPLPGAGAESMLDGQGSPLELSASSVVFADSHPFHEYTKMITVWNRDKHKRRVKLHHSPNYKLIRITPLSCGIAGAAQRRPYDPNMALVCGETLDFHITYTPTSATPGTFEVKLSHAREMNHKEGTDPSTLWAEVVVTVICSGSKPELELVTHHCAGLPRVPHALIPFGRLRNAHDAKDDIGPAAKQLSAGGPNPISSAIGQDANDGQEVPPSPMRPIRSASNKAVQNHHSTITATKQKKIEDANRSLDATRNTTATNGAAAAVEERDRDPFPPNPGHVMSRTLRDKLHARNLSTLQVTTAMAAARQPCRWGHTAVDANVLMPWCQATAAAAIAASFSQNVAAGPDVDGGSGGGMQPLSHSLQEVQQHTQQQQQQPKARAVTMNIQQQQQELTQLMTETLAAVAASHFISVAPCFVYSRVITSVLVSNVGSKGRFVFSVDTAKTSASKVTSAKDASCPFRVVPSSLVIDSGECAAIDLVFEPQVPGLFTSGFVANPREIYFSGSITDALDPFEVEGGAGSTIASTPTAAATVAAQNVRMTLQNVTKAVLRVDAWLEHGGEQDSNEFSTALIPIEAASIMPTVTMTQIGETAFEELRLPFVPANTSCGSVTTNLVEEQDGSGAFVEDGDSSSSGSSNAQRLASCPLIDFKDACLGHESIKTVRIANVGPIPIDFVWDVAAQYNTKHVPTATDDTSSAMAENVDGLLVIEPRIGVLPPNSVTEFTLRHTTRVLSAVEGLAKLLLLGLPDPALITAREAVLAEAKGELITLFAECTQGDKNHHPGLAEEGLETEEEGEKDSRLAVDAAHHERLLLANAATAGPVGFLSRTKLFPVLGTFAASHPDPLSAFVAKAQGGKKKKSSSNPLRVSGSVLNITSSIAEKATLTAVRAHFVEAMNVLSAAIANQETNPSADGEDTSSAVVSPLLRQCLAHRHYFAPSAFKTMVEENTTQGTQLLALLQKERLYAVGGAGKKAHSPSTAATSGEEAHKTGRRLQRLWNQIVKVVDTFVATMAVPRAPVYCQAIRCVSDPQTSSVTVTPTAIADIVSSLVGCEILREFEITNHSNKEQRFWLDPPQGAAHPRVNKNYQAVQERRARNAAKGSFYPSLLTPDQFSHELRENCSVAITPDMGVLAPNSTIVVKCVITPKKPGDHYIDLEVYLPDLEADATEALRIQEELDYQRALRERGVLRAPNEGGQDDGASLSVVRFGGAGCGMRSRATLGIATNNVNHSALQTPMELRLNASHQSNKSSRAEDPTGLDGLMQTPRSKDNTTANNKDAKITPPNGARPPIVMSRFVSIVARAVGAAVSVSAKMIDLGVIPLGEEGEGSLTITNNNPVAIAFSIFDPVDKALMAQREITPMPSGGAAEEDDDPRRYVFAPNVAKLRPGNSIKIDLFRVGREPGHVREFVLIEVENGQSTAIEVQALVQKPAVSASPSALNFGRVHREQPSERRLCLTNHSAMPIEYSLHVVGLEVDRPMSAAATAMHSMSMRSGATTAAAMMGGGAFGTVTPKGHFLQPAGGRSQLSSSAATGVRSQAHAPPPPHIILPPPGRLLAGQRDVPLNITATFFGTDPRPQTALVVLVSPQLDQPIPIELRCDEVAQLVVSLDVLVPSKCGPTTDQHRSAQRSPLRATVGARSLKQLQALGGASASQPAAHESLREVLAATLGPSIGADTGVELTRLSQSTKQFARDIIANILEDVLADRSSCGGGGGPFDGGASSAMSSPATTNLRPTFVDASSASHPSSASSQRPLAAPPPPPRHRLRPYCPAMRVPFATMHDSRPFVSTTAVVRIQNHSGCDTRFVAKALYFQAADSERNPARSRSPSLAITDGLGGSLGLGGGGGGGGGILLASQSRQPLSHKTKPGVVDQGQAPLTLTGGSQKSATGGGGPPGSRSHRPPPMVAPVLASIETKSIVKQLDGREEVEEYEELCRLDAAESLIDGKGCSIVVGNTNGPLRQHNSQDVHVSMLANIPGLHKDKLRVNVEGLPTVELDVVFSVKGRVVILDPATSGLAVNGDALSLAQAAATGGASGGSGGGGGGSNVPTRSALPRLLLPTMVAGVTTVSRRLRLTSRCPRDVEVYARFVDAEQFFQLRLIEKDLMGINAEDMATNGLTTAMVWEAANTEAASTAGGAGTAGVGVQLMSSQLSTRDVFSSLQQLQTVDTTITGTTGADGRPSSASSAAGGSLDAVTGGRCMPSRFIMRAMESAEITIEYAPPPRSTNDWRTVLVIATRIAATPYNDRFLVDEFYRLHGEAKGLAYERTLAPVGLVTNTVVAKSVQVRGVAKLPVRIPFINRPNIIKDSVILKAAVDEVAQAEAQMKSAAAAAAAAATGVVKPLDTYQHHTSDEGSDSDAEGDVTRRSSVASRDGGSTAQPQKGNVSAVAKMDAEISRRLREGRRQAEREEEERQMVWAYVLRRRRELMKESEEYFSPVEILVVAKNVRPRLLVEPATSVRFPLCTIEDATDALKTISTSANALAMAKRNTYVIRLTNNNTTPLSFTLGLDEMLAAGGMLNSTKARNPGQVTRGGAPDVSPPIFSLLSAHTTSYDSQNVLMEGGANDGTTAGTSTTTTAGTTTTTKKNLLSSAAAKKKKHVDTTTTASSALFLPGTQRHHFTLPPRNTLHVSVTMDTAAARRAILARCEVAARECQAKNFAAAAAAAASTTAIPHKNHSSEEADLRAMVTLFELASGRLASDTMDGFSDIDFQRVIMGAAKQTLQNTLRIVYTKEPPKERRDDDNDHRRGVDSDDDSGQPHRAAASGPSSVPNPPADPYTQDIPIAATVHLPYVIPQPSQILFRPTALVRDGRAEKHFSQIIRLVNYSAVDTDFRIAHVTAPAALSTFTTLSDSPTVLTPRPDQHLLMTSKAASLSRGPQLLTLLGTTIGSSNSQSTANADHRRHSIIPPPTAFEDSSSRTGTPLPPIHSGPSKPGAAAKGGAPARNVGSAEKGGSKAGAAGAQKKASTVVTLPPIHRPDSAPHSTATTAPMSLPADDVDMNHLRSISSVGLVPPGCDTRRPSAVAAAATALSVVGLPEHKVHALFDGFARVDDPARFSIVPSQGTVPAATIGGAPGELLLRVSFAEVAHTFFESTFEVVVTNDGASIDGRGVMPPSRFVLRGESKAPEL